MLWLEAYERRTQLLTICATMSSSVATSATVECWSMTSAAPSRLKSRGYLPRRCLLGSSVTVAMTTR